MSLPEGPYNPTESEKEILDNWLTNKMYKPEYSPTEDRVLSTEEMKKDPRPAWALICPPPNAYARPHIGNISGYAYQDAMARYARMQGKKVLVLPGKDHAGLEGEGVFVREVLEKQGRNKFDMKREDFYAEVMEFFIKNIDIARNDEKTIGLSADFDRDTFTLDPDIVETVLDTFVEMYKDNRIYKGVRIVNWDPKARSVIADNQCLREERDGKLFEIKYPLVKQRSWKLSFYKSSILERIKDGTKTIETRALNPEEKDRYFAEIKAGDLIICVDKSGEQKPSTYKKVSDIKIFKNLQDAFDKLDQENVFGKRFNNLEEFSNAYAKLAEGYDKKIDQNGLIAIELEDLDGTDYLAVATTRPETLLGDTAVAMNPEDKRYKAMKDFKTIIPLVDREVSIISSYKVEQGFGTGFLKVTPAHAQDDWQIMNEWNSHVPDLKSQVSFINVIGQDLKLTGPIPAKYKGRKYKEALEDILNDLKEAGLYVKEETIKQNILIAERTKAIVEPLISSQWYLKYDGLKEAAQQMVATGEVTIHPDNMVQKFDHWMNNLRDWAISRSLWWGYRMPVWYAGEISEEIDSEGKVQEHISLGRGEVTKTPLDYKNSDHLRVQKESPGEGWIQDENVLDTWFSSGQWVYATLTKHGIMDTFFPTDVLVSAHDILENWDSRMMMFTYFKHKQIPFKDLFLTGLVLGKDGQKMSKSRGNIIDMDKVRADYGTDAIRMAYFYQNSAGASYSITDDKLKNFKQFNNKIWNAAKFVLMNHSESSISISNLQLPLSKQIFEHINEVKQKVTKNMDNFEFGYATDTLYQEFWHDFCDVQIEQSKKYLYPEKDKDGKVLSEPKAEDKEEISAILIFTLKEYLKMLHPFIPFITEKIWREVPKSEGDHKTLMYSKW